MQRYYLQEFNRTYLFKKGKQLKGAYYYGKFYKFNFRSFREEL